MLPPLLLSGQPQMYLEKTYGIDEITSQQVNKEPTYLEVAKDAVFLGPVQPAGRRSHELCAAAQKEIAGGGTAGTSVAFILSFHITEQSLNTTETAT